MYSKVNLEADGDKEEQISERKLLDCKPAVS